MSFDQWFETLPIVDRLVVGALIGLALYAIACLINKVRS